MRDGFGAMSPAGGTGQREGPRAKIHFPSDFHRLIRIYLRISIVANVYELTINSKSDADRAGRQVGRRQKSEGTEEAFLSERRIRHSKSASPFVPKRNKLVTRTRTSIGRVPHTSERKRGVRGVLGGTAICVVVGTNLRGWGAAAGENSAPYFPIRLRVPN